MTWRTRPDGSLDLAILTSFELAATDGALAVRLDLARTAAQLQGQTAPDIEQIVLSPKVAAALIAELSEHLAPPSTPGH